MTRRDLPDTTPLGEGARISRGTAATLTAGLLLLIVLPAVWQTWSQPQVQAQRFRSLVTQLPSATSLAAFDRGLADESSLTKAVRQRYQDLVFRSLGQGNYKITVARDGFWFLRQDLGLCAGPGLMREGSGASHPSLAVIADYSARLAERGVHLVVVPVPVAPALYPEKAWPGYAHETGPANNVDWGAWLGALRSAGVDVVDLAPVYWREKTKGRDPLFLERNTHWAPRGVVVAAREAAARARPFLEATSRESFDTRTTSCIVPSELLPMLDLPPSTGVPPMRYEVTDVLRGGEIAEGDDSAPVLLLGDSFSRMYTGDDPGDGCGGGGFAQHLMLALGVSVQSLAVTAANPTDIRMRLAERKGSLRGRRVLVWQFTTRYLLERQDFVWKAAPLPSD